MGALGWSRIFAHTETRLPSNAIQPCLFPLLILQLLLQEGGLDAAPTPQLTTPSVSSALGGLTLSRHVRPRGWGGQGPTQGFLTLSLTFHGWALNSYFIPSPCKAARQPKCIGSSPLSPERCWNVPTVSQGGGPPGPSMGRPAQKQHPDLARDRGYREAGNGLGS